MSKPKITIVDDDRDTRELLAEALGAEGFEVMSAANGLRLVASLELHRPHAILLDVNMSWINGFELCQAVKQNKQFRDIPIIFISGRGDPEDKRRGMEVGAADYFVKPLELDALVKRIRQLIPADVAKEP
ncbi:MULTISPECIES: PleD family two-component system response regulator [Corallococcus]|uniref:Response regulator n=3 Tax=Corallococcus TaxID=83461 RepID=A0A3A8I0Z7_9BACT|nr:MULTISPECIES: response regulator [Corallococcus]RKH53406.1 response regulator [Corallococcus sp. AB050B]MBN8228255.1 response regulator [Corallococcus macrosporus]NOK36625.1 response regulator [Corallococcus exercitus]RKG71861.1 response regulator [Corallococcus exercitus]RKH61685.1 response regulator [Corallococcus interemptor]